MIVHDGTFNILRYHHRLGLTLQLVVAEYLGIKMCQHHLRLGFNGFGIALHIAAQQLLCAFIIIFRILLNALAQFIVAAISGIVGEHVQNEAFFNGLLHAVEVEGTEFSFCVFLSESFQRFFLGRSCEGKVATVRTHLSILHQAFQQYFRICISGVFIFLQRSVQLVCCYTALAAVGLVYDDGKVMVADITNQVTHKRELLNRSDDDTFAVLYMLFQSRLGYSFSAVCTICVSHYLVALAKRLDVVGYLLIQQPAVCHDDYRIVQWCIQSLGPYSLHTVRACGYQLIRQPCQRIRFS